MKVNSKLLPKPAKIEAQLQELPIAGRLFTLKRASACRTCQRKIDAGMLARIAHPSAITCESEACHLTKASKVTRLFPTAYGGSFLRDHLEIFARVYRLDARRFLVQRAPVVRRAAVLARAYVDLLEWQRAFDSYERWLDPGGYAEGRFRFLPPRRLDEVIVLRATLEPVSVSPVAGLPPEVRRQIEGIRRHGGRVPEPEPVPF